MTSNVGSASVYEAGDQRTTKDSEIRQEKEENRFHEGKDHSHKAQDSSMRYQVTDSLTPMINSCVQRTSDQLPTS